MLFDSLDFAVFLPLIFFLYWFVFNRNLRLQNLFLVGASSVFYGFWDVRFLILILFSTVVDYSVGRGLAIFDDVRKRKLLLGTSIGCNLGMLLYFKYYNFFMENFTEAFTFFGGEIEGNSLNIILPVGISFYTFQTLSYTIDAYYKKLTPTRDLIQFSAFVSFFPQLVAGPIERATNLLPQFERKRVFSYEEAVDGLRQLLWGLFKKIVIADNCAKYVNMVFDNSDHCNGSTLFLGSLLFGIQVYGDFSGYSDIAIGTARLFGFRLSRNFAFPFLSRNVAEFWLRWHISLSSWFRDYVYIPLGGNRGGKAKGARNMIIIFLVCGFWHGANWTYVAWGGVNALYVLPVYLSKGRGKYPHIVAYNKPFPSFTELAKILWMNLLLVISWPFFRGEDLYHTFEFLGGIFQPSFFTMPYLTPTNPGWPWTIVLVLFFVADWIGRKGEYGLGGWILKLSRPFRWMTYLALITFIFYFSGTNVPFLYFQF